MAAIGDVDEANSAIGVAIAAMAAGEARDALIRIQNELFDLGADLATPGADFAPSDGAADRADARSSGWSSEIDRDERRPRAAHQLHPAGRRSRPRRRCISPARSCAGRSAPRWPPRRRSRSIRLALAYLNRLSDFLFVCARACEPKRARRRSLAAGRDALIEAQRAALRSLLRRRPAVRFRAATTRGSTMRPKPATARRAAGARHPALPTSAI